MGFHTSSKRGNDASLYNITTMYSQHEMKKFIISEERFHLN